MIDLMSIMPNVYEYSTEVTIFKTNKPLFKS